MSKRLTALAVAALFVFGACGDDDDDGGGGGALGGDQTSSSSAGQGDGGGSAGEGYSDQVRDTFIGSCTAQPGASEEACGCLFDHISANVPFDEFREFEETAAEDPSTPLPDWLTEATESCS